MFPAGVGKGVLKCDRNCIKGIVEIELHNTTKTATCPLSTLLKTVSGSFGRLTPRLFLPLLVLRLPERKEEQSGVAFVRCARHKKEEGSGKKAGLPNGIF